ncbi:putative Ig domain-containing protein [Calothrix membranacea FACHB-236]|nr:putative Ig domain-containing protein [Calothrix membranacea FACHB-236]
MENLEFNLFNQGNLGLSTEFPLDHQPSFPELESFRGLPSSLLAFDKINSIPVFTPASLPPASISVLAQPSFPSQTADTLLGISSIVNAEAANFSFPPLPADWGSSLSSAIVKVRDSLKEFLTRSDFLSSLQLAFGYEWQFQTATNLIASLANGNYFPSIEVVNSEQIQSAGAFSQQTNTIYLSQAFLETNNIDAIATVVKEELGHYLDTQLNTLDSPGDEGQIFAALVQGTDLTPGKLQNLKTEDDHKIVTINGQTLLVEQSVNEIIGTDGRDVLTGTLLSDRIIGKAGADTVTGGLGSDTFVYQSIRDAGDIIKDFELRQDVIDLSVVLTSFGYGGLNPIADGYIKFSTYTAGTVILLDSDGQGSLSARPYIYVEKVTPTDLSSYPNHFLPNPGKPPQIQADLVNDTGASASDRLTLDPTISGQTTDATSVLVNLNGNGFVDVSDALNPDGSFSISLEQYDLLANGSLPSGANTLQFKAVNSSSLESEIVTVSFTLDRNAPPLSFELAPESDTGVLGDGITSERTVTLIGQTDPGLEVVLVETQQRVTADDQGNFTFTNVSMPVAGKAPFTMVAVDAAGNQGRAQKFLTREGINGAPEISSTPELVFDTETQQKYTYQVEATDPDGDNLTYTLINVPLGAEIDENGVLSFTPLTDLKPFYDFSVEVNDGRGGTDVQTFKVEVPALANLGTIKGIKWNDLNKNGVRDNTDDSTTTSLTVQGTDVIFLAGRDDVTIPPLGTSNSTFPILRHSFIRSDFLQETFPQQLEAASGDIFTFSATGSIDFSNGSSRPFATPDGGNANGSSLLGIKGISGYEGAEGALVGVFLNDDNPLNNPTPLTLDFKTNALGQEFEILSPKIGQVFFIGNGLTSTNEQHKFVAPEGTTRLFLGIADGWSFDGVPGYYDDNDGAYNVTANRVNSRTEPGLAGVSIYLDANNNGKLDPGEPIQVTAKDNPNTPNIDETGEYEFNNLSPGTYIVREIVPPDFKQTFPTSTETGVGDGFADIVLDYFNSATGTFNEAYGSDNAGRFPVLVPIDIILGSDTQGSLSLPKGSYVTVGFTDEIIIDNPGNDIFIPEVGAYGEKAEVFVSANFEDFTFLGIGNGGTTSIFDLASIGFTEPVRAIKIVGLDNGGGSSGFDVINVQGLPGSVTSPDFYTVELEVGEVVENINFGNAKVVINQNPTIVSKPITQITKNLSQGEPELIDLSTWSIVNYELFSQPDAQWVIQPGNTEVEQIINSDASILLGDFDLSADRIEGTWNVNSFSDDDLMGFVFGYQDSEHFYLFDWKQASQNDPLGFAEQGMSLKVVNANSPLTGKDLWATIGNGERVKTLFHNTIPWSEFTDYQFALDFTPRKFTITVSEGKTVLESFTIEDDTYTNGKFGFYNYSQSNVSYQGFTKANIFLGDYFYDVEAIDADGDVLTYSLLESPNDATIDSYTGEISWKPTTEGLYDFTVQVEDGNGGIDTQSFVVEVTNENQAPIITSIPDRDVLVNNEYSYQVEVFDGDGDDLSYALTTAPIDMTVDENGLIVWNSHQEGTFAVEVKVSDGQGGVTTQSYEINVIGVTEDTEAPQVNLGFNSIVLKLGETLNLQIQGFDNVGLADLDLSFNNNSLALSPDITTNGLINTASVTLNKVGVFQVVAKATDLAGNIDTEVISVRVINPNDKTAPIVALDLSAFDPFNPIISEPTNIIGTINDPELEFYRVELAPVDLVDLSNPAAKDSDYITIAEGKGNVDNGILAKIDPLLYRNDTYYVRVYTQDYSGNINVEGLVLGINTQNKPGSFALEFTDLSIPLTGIPIEIQRRYDSLDAKFSGDFGYGWNLGFQDAQIQEASPTGVDLSFDDFFGGNSFTVGTRVTLTTPDGRRVGFTFNPTPDAASFLGTRYKPTFTPDAGVYDRLEVDYTPLTLRSDGSVGLFLFGFTYNPSQYRLITKDGITYRYDQHKGLLDITDKNGNKLTYTNAGIVSSTGQSITFQRDAQGRITEIIDPSGKSLKYNYDAKGDLIAFTDSTNNKTQFTYDTTQTHYLREITDPLGRKGIRTEYDDQGRLIRLIDAEGNALDLSYSSGASSQTVKDPLGNTITRVFDVQGNVVQEVDALGGITQRTFDNNNNLLSETDPEGNTKTYTYDSRGNKLTETDGEGNVTRYTYNANNKLLTETDGLGNTTTYAYDAKDNLFSRKDSLGNVTSYKYDARGNLIAVIYPTGKESTFVYDLYGNLTQLIDPTGAKTSFTYDKNGRVATTTDALGAITNYIYDAQGRLIEKADPEGSSCGCARGITKTEYNAAGEKIAEIDALGRRTEYRYNDRGLLIETILPDETPNDLSDNPRIKNEYDKVDRLIASIDEAGRKTHYFYDKLGRRIEVIYPDATPNDLSDNPRTQTEYDKAGRVIAEIDELGNRTEFVYDQAGRQIIVRNALGQETQYIYDAAGRQISTIDALGRDTDYVYDALGRLLVTEYVDGTKQSTTYDALGRIIAQADQANNTTRFEYDGLGRLTAVVDSLNQLTEYKYDAVGNMIEQKDANGHVTKFEYDSLRRRQAMILPDGQRNETIHNKIGNLIRTTDFNGVTTTYEYDARDRLIQKSFSDGTPTETFSYTLTGELATVTDNRGVTNYVYDQRDRLLSRTEADTRQIAYTYDLAGNITSLIVPSGTTSYTYDPLNRLATVTDPDSGVSRYSYDVVGNLIKTEFPNGVSETQTYNALNRLTYLENRNQTGIISSYSYTLDAVGNRMKVEENNGRVVEYSYDQLYRLTQEKITDAVAGNKIVTYKFDPVGNRLERVDSVEGTTAYSYDANDRLLEEVLGGKVTQYEYDNNGNLTATIENGQTQTQYEWNAKGELVAVETTENGETGRVEFEYDHEGIRVAIKIDGEETRFLIDSNQQEYAQVIEEYQTNSTVDASYVHGWDLISQENADGRIYYQVDGLDSTRLLTNNKGVIVQEYNYDAYGNLTWEIGDESNNYLFTGEHIDDATDGYYLRARYYDPVIGRFVSRDSFEGFKDQPVTLHDYLYANVNPVLFTDPTGQSVLINRAVTIGTITGAILAPTFDIVCKASVDELGEVTISREIRKSVAGAALGATIGGTIAYSTLKLLYTGNSIIDSFLVSQFMKTQVLFKVPTIGVLSLGGKIFVLENCDFLEFISAGF